MERTSRPRYPPRPVAPGTGLRFTVPGSGVFELTGHAYLPDGPPAERDGNSYTRLSGHWYAWTDNGHF
ncbi:hypothetical protein [Kitasatospora sp. NPDC088351]|uniref:hypothetical protein n=1 Tax=unclassified Kitasatospora TaxID=2633591 RepID=UPI0034269EBC